MAGAAAVRTPWRIATLVFVTFLVLYVATTRGHFVSTDEVTVYQAAQSLWEKGDASVRVHDTREVFRGRGGAIYGQYNSGQSIAVLPLYAIGRAVDRSLAADSVWRRVLAGHRLSRPGVVWSGEIPIFFVNLFNAFVTAALMVVFFALVLQMTQSTRWSLIATLLLGSTTFIAPFSNGFFQHAGEALFSLSAFTLFFLDRRAPGLRLRVAAGALLAVMIVFRFPAIIALPGLLAYHAASVWVRRQNVRRAVTELLPALSGVAAGYLLHALDQYWKFGSTSIVGYQNLGFSTPLAVGIYGYLLSPGMSVFVYTPLLVLLPFAIPAFYARFRTETLFLLLHACVYLVAYGRYTEWSGLWYFGPRYLAPLVPFLFLPVAVWMSEKRERSLVAVVPLALAGLWMQVIHVGANFWFVASREGFLQSGPRREFLFNPYDAPFVAQSRALLAGDNRVDMWLVDVARFAGGAIAAGLAIVFAAVVIGGLLAIARELGREEGEALPRSWAYAAAAVPLAIVAFAFGLGATVHMRNLRAAAQQSVPWRAVNVPAQPPAIPVQTATARAETTRPSIPAPVRTQAVVTDDELMKAGMDALYQRGDPAAAEIAFRTVLRRTPAHYGAHYQLAVALDRSGRSDQAEGVWTNVLKMAEVYRDEKTAARARERLSRR